MSNDYKFQVGDVVEYLDFMTWKTGIVSKRYMRHISNNAGRYMCPHYQLEVEYGLFETFPVEKTEMELRLI